MKEEMHSKRNECQTLKKYRRGLSEIVTSWRCGFLSLRI